jgi:hypothetical protein
MQKFNAPTGYIIPAWATEGGGGRKPDQKIVKKGAESGMHQHNITRTAAPRVGEHENVEHGCPEFLILAPQKVCKTLMKRPLRFQGRNRRFLALSTFSTSNPSTDLLLYIIAFKGGGHYAASLKVADSIPDEVIRCFQLTYSFQPHYGPGVDSATNRNEYQESSLGVKPAGA